MLVIFVIIYSSQEGFKVEVIESILELMKLRFRNFWEPLPSKDLRTLHHEARFGRLWSLQSSQHSTWLLWKEPKNPHSPQLKP